MRLNKIVLAGVMFAVGAALITTTALAAGRGVGKQGGTLRINVSHRHPVDRPGVDYEIIGWAHRVRDLPEARQLPGQAGRWRHRLVPEAATALPRVSADGKTYTFTIRPRLRVQHRRAGHCRDVRRT